MRTLLLVLATSIIIGVIIFFNFIVSSLIEKEKNLIEAWASTQKAIANSASNGNNLGFDLFETVQEIQSKITFPVVLTNEDEQPNYPFDKNSLNIELNPNLTTEDQRFKMEERIKDMGEKYEPILIRNKDGKVLSKLFYTNSTLINFLTIFPYFALVSISGFIIFSFIVFNNIRTNQESMVWVGMSKEAAHQLGTPLSSILAWIEILRLSENLEPDDSEALDEIKKDVERLSIVANRFAKIGSKPELETTNLAAQLSKARQYFQKRLPHLGRKVIISEEIKSRSLRSKITPELFSWVLENLIKNAAESIESKDGKILLKLTAFGNTAEITIKDNGKGMSSSVKSRIFNPGFTTKTRGWGLGLSLSRRIIEEYHNGKLYVKETTPGGGTTFAIELPLN